MNKKHIRFISILMGALVMLSIAFVARPSVSAATNPLLYWNDRNWTRESRQGIESINDVYYIPVTLFTQFENVRVRTNKVFKTFIIENGDKFLSFNTESDFALNDEDKRMYIKTYILHDEHYVPAKTVCEFLDLGYEQLKSPVTGEVAIRITDGTQKASFRKVIMSRYPGFYEDQTTSTSTPQTESGTTPPITTPPVTTEVIDEPLTDRTIYLTIEDCPGEWTEEILELLSEFGYKATFFVTGEAMKKSPAMLSRIIAEGHAIALHSMTHDEKALADTDAILADIEAQNELLFAFVKQRSRIWRAPEGSRSLASLTLDAAHEISQQGYLIWDYNIDAGTAIKLSERNIERAADKVIKGIRDYEMPIIRFNEGESTASVMRLVLEFIAENAEVCELRTILPAHYEYSNISG